MVSGDVTTIKDYWLMLLQCGDVVTTFFLFYSLADVIAKDVADVIATVVVPCMLLLKALLCQWQMLLPLCFIWLMLLPMAEVIARWLMLLPHLISVYDSTLAVDRIFVLGSHEEVLDCLSSFKVIWDEVLHKTSELKLKH